MKSNTKLMQLYPTGFDYTYEHEIKELLMEQLITHGQTVIGHNSLSYSPAIVLIALADGYMERIRDHASDQTYLRITKKGLEFLNEK